MIYSYNNYYVIFNPGPSLYPHDIISNHTANSPTECSLRCLEKSTCVGFNYKTKSNRYVINCQVGSKTKEKNIKKNETKGEWTFYQDVSKSF